MALASGPGEFEIKGGSIGQPAAWTSVYRSNRTAVAVRRSLLATSGLAVQLRALVQLAEYFDSLTTSHRNTPSACTVFPCCINRLNPQPLADIPSCGNPWAGELLRAVIANRAHSENRSILGGSRRGQPNASMLPHDYPHRARARGKQADAGGLSAYSISGSEVWQRLPATTRSTPPQ